MSNIRVAFFSELFTIPIVTLLAIPFPTLIAALHDAVLTASVIFTVEFMSNFIALVPVLSTVLVIEVAPGESSFRTDPPHKHPIELKSVPNQNLNFPEFFVEDVGFNINI
ncbi:uncharacterized protein BCR38DRAFT_481935 [Pseudomassariella vexata]|uniref:Uncharacterized protein n=1 Tax=Pseudomassariella vexata TaxID=1141098 RepID=A0A1Y2EA31_9PEZI|nr:uncharacterized protein BCR38DRAFT_481935 [Pseudomassariella vexata]ORY68448.1 hypothetical protein BCR38DRAFT_481935 [Pseudomassariella vexata]